MKTLYLSLIVGSVLCFAQSQDNHLQSGYDPQLLSYQLQQLALQQYSGLQNSQQQQLDLQQYSNVQNPQPQQFNTQPVQFPAQSSQGAVPQARQQPLNSQQYLQQSLFQPAYEGQYTNSQSPSQISQDVSLRSGQQLPKQSLLGVAYSSAADASRTSFTGYGVKYSF